MASRYITLTCASRCYIFILQSIVSLNIIRLHYVCYVLCILCSIKLTFTATNYLISCIVFHCSVCKTLYIILQKDIVVQEVCDGGMVTSDGRILLGDVILQVRNQVLEI